MKKAILILMLAVFGVAVRADDLSNPAVFSTNAAYAATAGYALTSADGTNALAQLATATGRVAALEAVDITTTGRVAVLEASKVTVTGQVAALQAVDITTTGRVAVLEASNITVTGQVAALQAVDVTTTGRVAAVEYKLGVLMTNTYITGVTTNGSGEVTAYTTTNHVFYLPR